MASQCLPFHVEALCGVEMRGRTKFTSVNNSIHSCRPSPTNSVTVGLSCKASIANIDAELRHSRSASTAGRTTIKQQKRVNSKLCGNNKDIERDEAIGGGGGGGSTNVNSSQSQLQFLVALVLLCRLNSNGLASAVQYRGRGRSCSRFCYRRPRFLLLQKETQ